jgi:hypothetical protein
MSEGPGPIPGSGSQHDYIESGVGGDVGGYKPSIVEQNVGRGFFIPPTAAPSLTHAGGQSILSVQDSKIQGRFQIMKSQKSSLDDG